MNKAILLTSLLAISVLIMNERLLNAEAERDPDIDIRLRFAIVQSDIESVKSFLREGADPNAVYPDGGTPLGEAIVRSRGSIDMVRVLIQFGADPKIKANGVSPLSLAQKQNNEELILILRDYVENDAELFELALFYLNKEKEVMALHYAEEALKLNPLNAKAWALKGSLFLSLYNSIKDAGMAYRKAFEASLANLKANKSEDDYRMAVRCALLSSNFNEALRLAKEGLSLFQHDGYLELNGAHAMLLLGSKKEATAFYKKAYADLQLSKKTADLADRLVTDDFAELTALYPQKAPELKWAEKEIYGP